MPQETAATWSLSGLSRRIERCAIHWRQSCSATQAPVIEAVRVPPSACNTSQSMVICRSPRRGRSTTDTQRSPDEALNLLGATRNLAGRGFALGSRRGRARQHCVFGRHPSSSLTAQPRRRLFLERGRAEHVRFPEANETRTLGIARDPALEADWAHFVVGAFGRTHGRASLSLSRLALTADAGRRKFAPRGIGGSRGLALTAGARVSRVAAR